MVESGEGWKTGKKISNRPSQASTDDFGLIFRDRAKTHTASVAHFFWNGKAYNSQPSYLVSTSMGATIESIELAKNGIVTRGILVDIPLLKEIDWLERGTGVMPEDTLAAENKFGFKTQPGDILLVRTGNYTGGTHKIRSIQTLGGVSSNMSTLTTRGANICSRLRQRK